MPLAIPPPAIGLGSGRSDQTVIGTGTSVPPGVDAIIEFNNLLMNNREWLDTYMITEIDGLGDADIRDDREVNPQAHGETFFESYYGGRTVTLTGKIRCFSLYKLRDMEQALRQAFADLSQERELIFHSQNPATDASLMCKKSAPLVMKEVQSSLNEFNRDFLVTLRASNPRFLSRLTSLVSKSLGVVDSFVTDSIAFYTFDTGAGTLSVTGGQLVPSSTVQKRAIRNDQPNYSDADVVIKYIPDATFTASMVGGVIRHLDSNNYLFGRINASGVLEIGKVDGGVSSTLNSGGSVSRSASTSYWIRFRGNGNVLTVEHFTSDPRIGAPTPTASITFTLAGGDITKFGNGIYGQTGFRFDPGSTAWRVDDLSVGPYAMSAIQALAPENLGNFDAQPTITIAGPITNPVLLNNSTGESLSFTGTIAAGDQYVIDTAARSAVNSAGANVFNKLNVGSTWFGLGAGINNLQLNGSATSPVSSGGVFYVPTLTVLWKNSWI